MKLGILDEGNDNFFLDATRDPLLESYMLSRGITNVKCSTKHKVTSSTEVSGIPELGNLWVLVQLIHRPMRTKNQLYKTQTLHNSRIPDTSVHQTIYE